MSSRRTSDTPVVEDHNALPVRKRRRKKARGYSVWGAGDGLYHEDGFVAIRKQGENQVTVHSLDLWSTQKEKQGKRLFEISPTFSMAFKETLEHLKQVQRRLLPLSGAEGYAGALFEACAICCRLAVCSL